MINEKKVSFNSYRLREEDKDYLKTLDDKYIHEFDVEDESTFYHDEDYARLNENVILYKQGNREAAEYIIAAFHNTLRSYAHFIVLHTIPYKRVIDKNGRNQIIVQPTIAKFIRLFNTGKSTKGRAKNSELRETAEYIYKLFNKFEYGDIYNELCLALLNMANKYKVKKEGEPGYKRNGTFHVYIEKCFHWEAFRFLTKLSNDALIFQNPIFFSTDDNNYEEDEEDGMRPNLVVEDLRSIEDISLMIDYVDRQTYLRETNKVVLKEDNIDLRDEDSLNFNWINGAVTNPIFEVLTPYERELLVLSHMRGQTEDELAALYGYSRSTIGLHKRRAKDKLKEAMGLQTNKKEET